MPDASRFDQRLQLTERLVTSAESQPPEPDAQPLYTECLQKLKDFFLVNVTNAPGLASSRITVPVTEPTRHHPSTNIGIEVVGYTFTDRALGRCKVLAPSTYTDETNTVWNTLDFTSSTYPNETAWIKKDKNHRAPSPATPVARPAPQQQLTQGPIPEPYSQPINKYDLRSHRGAASAKRIRRNHRADRRAYAAVLAIPEAYVPPTHQVGRVVPGWPVRSGSLELETSRVVDKQSERGEAKLSQGQGRL
jgi:hypothetical protein